MSVGKAPRPACGPDDEQRRAARWALLHEDPAGVRRFGLHFS